MILPYHLFNPEVSWRVACPGRQRALQPAGAALTELPTCWRRCGVVPGWLSLPTGAAPDGIIVLAHRVSSAAIAPAAPTAPTRYPHPALRPMPRPVVVSSRLLMLSIFSEFCWMRCSASRRGMNVIA